MRETAFIVDLFLFIIFSIMLAFYRRTQWKQEESTDYVHLLFRLNLSIIIFDIFINVFLNVQECLGYGNAFFIVVPCLVLILFLYCTMRLNYLYYVWDLTSLIERKRHPIHIIAFILTIIDAFFGSRYLFLQYISDQLPGTWMDSLDLFGQICGAVTWIIILYYILSNRKKLGWRDTLVLMELPVIPLCTFFIKPVEHRSLFWALGVSSALLMIYNVIRVNRVLQFKEQEKLLTDTRMQLALSQIGDHFVYNVLNSIYVLCVKDPKMAQKAIVDFSNYFRSNMANLEREGMVSLKQEMDHVRSYLELEKMRFSGEIQVEIDLKQTGFEVPVFSIQPIVENAVKHGLNHQKGGGTIRIRTWKEEGSYIVEVADDGVGFVREDYDELHVGIRNVKKRLEILCSGTLEIVSRVGEGTTVRMHIPEQLPDQSGGRN